MECKKVNIGKGFVDIYYFKDIDNIPYRVYNIFSLEVKFFWKINVVIKRLIEQKAKKRQ